MKKVVNGTVVEMTAEEIADLHTDEHVAEPTAEERLDALEAAMLEVLEVIANG